MSKQRPARPKAGAQGREKYRTLLDVGQAAISRVLSTAHRALPAGAPSAWRSATLWPISPSAPAACPGRAHRRRAARAGDRGEPRPRRDGMGPRGSCRGRRSHSRLKSRPVSTGSAPRRLTGRRVRTAPKPSGDRGVGRWSCDLLRLPQNPSDVTGQGTSLTARWLRPRSRRHR